MPDRPKKLDAKSRKIAEQLERCIKKLADDKYAPPGFEKRPDASEDEKPAGSFRFLELPTVDYEEFRRLKAWLVALEDWDESDVFAAILQVWLDVHGIAWPKGIFRPDLATFGSGIRRSGLGPAASTLRDQKKTWGQIAQKLLPNECKTPEGRRKASDKVRLAAQALKQGVRRERPIEGSVAALVWRMLDVKPSWLLEQEIREELDREAEDPGS